MTQKILVAWFQFNLNGSIGRFINVARVLKARGHAVRFVSLDNILETPWPELNRKILTVAEAAASQWDAVMLPGAGASSDALQRLATLRNPTFGTRVQHILNDPSLLPQFAVANVAFRPDLVLFNNSHWRPRDYRKLSAKAFYVHPGAVDLNIHHPIERTKPSPGSEAVNIGGFASKNPIPLIESLDLLPPQCRLHLFGTLPVQLASALTPLIESGKIVYHGILFGKELAKFFRSLDCMVTTEIQAGWCNAAAEAFANGIPTVVSKAGTVDFARDGENCLVIKEVTREAIAKAVVRFLEDPALRESCATNAAKTMESFSWESYAVKLLELIKPLEHAHYFRAPEMGLFGKWELEERISGIRSVVKEARGSSILDLGAAEGVISHVFAEEGEASLIHGFEFEQSRVDFAKNLLASTISTKVVIRQADLSDWPSFEQKNDDILRRWYDIVLFVGVYHHLPSFSRKQVLVQAMRRSRKWFLIRTPRQYERADNLDIFVQSEGFERVDQAEARINENLGWLGVYRRGSEG